MEPERLMIDSQHIESAVSLFAGLAEMNVEQSKHFADILPDVADWHRARAEAYALCADYLSQYVANLAEKNITCYIKENIMDKSNSVGFIVESYALCWERGDHKWLTMARYDNIEDALSFTESLEVSSQVRIVKREVYEKVIYTKA